MTKVTVRELQQEAFEFAGVENLNEFKQQHPRLIENLSLKRKASWEYILEQLKKEAADKKELDELKFVF